MRERCVFYKKLINDFLNGEISKAEELALMEHINVCISCRREFEALNKISKAAKEIERIKAPENFTKMIKNKIKSGQKKRSRFMEIFLVAAASVVLFVMGFTISSTFLVKDGNFNHTPEISEKNLKMEIPLKNRVRPIRPEEINIKDNYKKWEKVYLEEVSH